METQQRLLTRALNRAEHRLTDHKILRFSLGPGSALWDSCGKKLARRYFSYLLFYPVFYLFQTVQKCNFFLYLFSLKIRLEIMFNTVLDRKETFFGHKNFNLSKSQKSHFFKGVNQCFWSKNVLFLLLFSLKIRLEIMFNNLLDRKKTVFAQKNFSLSKSQKSHFSKGVNPNFWSKTVIFFFIFFPQNKSRNNV